MLEIEYLEDKEKRLTSYLNNGKIELLSKHIQAQNKSLKTNQGE